MEYIVWQKNLWLWTEGQVIIVGNENDSSFIDSGGSRYQRSDFVALVTKGYYFYPFEIYFNFEIGSVKGIKQKSIVERYLLCFLHQKLLAKIAWK